MKKKFRFQWGAFLMFLFYGGLFFLLFIRLLSIQITGEVEGRPLAALAEAKYAKENSIKAERGKILDRNGDAIAADTLSYRVVAILSKEATPKGSKVIRHVTDYRKTAEILSNYIPMKKEQIQSIMEGAIQKNPDVYQVEFGAAGRDISYETMKKIEKAIEREKLTGIIFFEDKKRFYPNGVFASHLIGYATREKIEEQYKMVGKMGLEKTFDKQLTGQDGKINFQTDVWGFMLPKTKESISPAKDGYNIHLTIDKTIQNFVEDAMNRVVEEYQPQKMLVIVANPKTGEIYAMSQRPTFHPETRRGLSENWLNDAVESTIEPGSTMKMFTLAAAIEEKKWNPNAYYQSGQYTIYDRTIRDVNRSGWGTISYLEGFQRSSNVLMAYLLEKVGDRKFIEYLQSFGFGEPVGIDLPNEAAGILLDRYPSERLTTSYGQGSTVTPIQMIQAATAIANDGVMMKPYLIDKIVDPNTDEIISQHESEKKGTPISAETAKQVRSILASTITSEFGTARDFALQGYEAGGKTGTAEIPRKNGNGYLSGRGNYLYSFLGMAPIDDPQLITYVLVQQPKLKDGEWGAEPVSKAFNPIMESSLKYLNILPEKETVQSKTIEIASFKGKDSSQVIEELGQKGLKVVLIGEGGVIRQQYPLSGTILTEGSTVLLQTEGATVLPDFYGWSKKMVLNFKLLSGLDLRVTGEGFVTEQSVSAGTKITTKDPVVIRLATPSEQVEKENTQADEQIVGG